MSEGGVEVVEGGRRESLAGIAAVRRGDGRKERAGRGDAFVFEPWGGAQYDE